MENSEQTKEEMQQKASEISQRIQALADFDGESLKGEMAALKKALLENPSACTLLHDEDIGMAVANLRIMVGIAVASAASSKKGDPKAKQKNLSPAELAAALAAVPDEEFI